MRHRYTHKHTAPRDWLDADGRFIFGAHKGELAEDVAKHDYTYIQWILDEVENCSADDREVFSALLTMHNAR